MELSDPSLMRNFRRYIYETYQCEKSENNIVINSLSFVRNVVRVKIGCLRIILSLKNIVASLLWGYKVLDGGVARMWQTSINLDIMDV